MIQIQCDDYGISHGKSLAILMHVHCKYTTMQYVVKNGVLLQNVRLCLHDGLCKHIRMLQIILTI